MAPRCLFFFAVLALQLSAWGALAQDAKREAMELFARGSAAYARGQFAEAARDFEASHRQVPRAAAIYNAARAWDAAGDPMRAADAYETALDHSDLRGVEAQQARARLDELERGMGMVTVGGPVGAILHVDGDRVVSIPALVHLAPGEHELVLELAGGDRGVEHVRVAAGERRSTSVALLPRAAPARPPSPATDAAITRPTSSGIGPGAGWIAAGTAAIFSGAAVACWLEANHLHNEFVATGRTDADLHDRGETFVTLTNAAWIGAGIAGVTAAVLLVFAYARREERPLAGFRF